MKQAVTACSLLTPLAPTLSHTAVLTGLAALATGKQYVELVENFKKLAVGFTFTFLYILGKRFRSEEQIESQQAETSACLLLNVCSFIKYNESLKRCLCADICCSDM